MYRQPAELLAHTKENPHDPSICQTNPNTGGVPKKTKSKFKVRIATITKVILFILIVAIVCTIALLIMENAISRMNVPSKVLGIVLLVWVAAFVISNLLFMVAVNDGCIFVRTRLGKRFRFHISEIVKLDYWRERYKYGEYSTMLIKTNDREVMINQKMDGFLDMGKYILEKLESGEINETAATLDIRMRVSEDIDKEENGRLFKR